MNIIYKNLLGLSIFFMVVLTYSCSSTIKWDKVNVDPLTNIVTFKKNNEKVSGTVYVNGKLYATFKISSQQLYSNRF